jgi:hypothetical protein
MGHLVNPVSFRLGHNRFWSFICSSPGIISKGTNSSFFIMRDLLHIERYIRWFVYSTVFNRQLGLAISKIFYVSTSSSPLFIIQAYVDKFEYGWFRSLLSIFNFSPVKRRHNSKWSVSLFKDFENSKTQHRQLIISKYFLTLINSFQISNRHPVQLAYSFRLLIRLLFILCVYKTIKNVLLVLTKCVHQNLNLLINNPGASKIEICFNLSFQVERSASLIGRYMSARTRNKFIINSTILKILEDLRCCGGVLGYKIAISGRVSRKQQTASKWWRERSLPLSTIDARIDYYSSAAVTKFGQSGYKIWLHVQPLHINKLTKLIKTVAVTTSTLRLTENYHRFSLHNDALIELNKYNFSTSIFQLLAPIPLKLRPLVFFYIRKNIFGNKND